MVSAAASNAIMAAWASRPVKYALVAATSCFLDISADLESDRVFSLILPIAGQCSEWSSTDVRSANHTAQRPRASAKLASN
jgi:hypothetical protein